jgi:hypothetical protein
MQVHRRTSLARENTNGSMSGNGTGSGSDSEAEGLKGNRERSGSDSNAGGGMKRILNFVNFLRRDSSDSPATPPAESEAARRIGELRHELHLVPDPETSIIVGFGTDALSSRPPAETPIEQHEYQDVVQSKGQ